jgi:hypothetical protein
MNVVAGIYRMVLAVGVRSSRFVFGLLIVLVGVVWFLEGCKTCYRFILLELSKTNAVTELIDNNIEIRNLI